MSHQENKWMILLDKLNSLNRTNQNILHILLFQILLQELILKEKGYQPFWTPAYKELSEKLLSPIEIDCAVSDTIYLNTLLQNKAEQLQSSMMTSIKALNKNYQKTCFQLSTSTLVNKWEKEVIKSKVIKNLKVPLNLNRVQQKIINEWCNTSNYIYNKTLEKIKSGAKPNWMNLRDSLVISKTKKNSTEYKTSTDNNKIFKEKYNEVTNSIIHDINIEYKNVDKIKSNKIKLILEKFKKSREDDLKIITNNLNQERRNMVKNIKYEKNTNINTWELNTPKEVRTCAIKEVCNAYKTNFTLFKNGKCGYFNIKYRKKTKNEKCVSIPKSFLKIENDNNNKYIRIAPTFFKEKLEESDDIELNELESTNPNHNSKLLIGKKTLKNNNLQMIEHDCKIIKQHNKWFILIPISVNINKKEKPINYCGIDPGTRTFLTTFGNNNSTEYDFRLDLLKKLNKQIIILKNGRYKKIRKLALTKREEKKSNIINDLHWKSINHLLKENDVIFYGDIKSHNIVSKSKNRHLNRSFNDIKFYKFKERLKYKASIANKLLVCVPEDYTSQTCSFCGAINKPEKSKIYFCNQCQKRVDRDVNAAKNILMKGLLMDYVHYP